jgi:hypothetical protein
MERATARSTARFQASETNVLRERELQNRYALHLFVFKTTGGPPRVRYRKRPVTPCVPARVDRHYCNCRSSTRDIVLPLLGIGMQQHPLYLLSWELSDIYVLLLLLTSQGNAWPDRYL